MSRVVTPADVSSAPPQPIGVAPEPRPVWKQGIIAITLSVVAILLVFHETVAALLSTWQSGAFSHCYLILPISVFLIWDRRHQIAPILPQVARGGFLLLAFLAFLWMLGNIADVLFIEEFALVAMLPALAWTLFGTAVVRRIIFPLAFLFFAVPVGLSLIRPLQESTANIATQALELTGVPVMREGLLLVVPNGAWEIAQECSGIRFLIACVTLGTLSAFLLYRSWIRRLIFIGAAIIVPIVANGLRAYGIILLGYLSNNRLAKGVDHLVYGWIFFSFVLMLLLAAGWRWRQDTQPKATPRLPTGAAVENRNHAPIGLVGSAVLAVIVVALAPLTAHALFPAPVETAPVRMAAFQPSVPWAADAAVEAASRQNVPHIANASAEWLQEFSLGDQKVDLYVAYNPPGAAKKLAPPDNLFLNPDKWVVASARRSVVQLEGEDIDVNETLMHTDETQRLVWSFYWIEGEFTASPLRSRFLEAKSRLLSHRRGESAIVVFTDVRTDARDAALLLQHFLDTEALLRYLETAGS